MKKNKLLIASALSVSLLGAAAISSAIFADSEVTDSANISTTATQDVGTTTTGDHVVTPQNVGNTFGSRVQGGATVQSSFDVPRGYGHVKLTLKNNSSYPVRVSLLHNDSGKEYISGTRISPGSSITWRSTDEGYTDGLRSGSYTLQWRGGDYNVNAEFNGIAGSRPADIR
ncbi:hypothetical protein [Paenibacillus sp. 23TSA30-6]|uniref:hypothetical protein n=1 Tax=Paenibacillus sp. 23TSA30-6 TaxID=2546104 RepID=UPI001787E42E|nr:hypothetical protein [Paenibacillus sp. 23TSA30-6]MBE0336182.1 hypothetical protein [Paenibacillus sp. 23TSA30-6]